MLNKISTICNRPGVTVHPGLLLADPSPYLRLLVLKGLFQKTPDDDEIRELQKLCREDYLIKDILTFQDKDGAWKGSEIQGTGYGNKVWTTAMVLKRLGYLGFSPGHPVVKKGAAYIFSCQLKNGAWPFGKNLEEKTGSAEATLIYSALILQGIALCGYAETKEAIKTYSWLLSFRLPDGAWPAGMVEGNYRGVAGYRRLAHSKFGCRSTTTAMATALAYHPTLNRSEEAKRALDLLLTTELKETDSIGFETARIIGAEQTKGLLTHYVHYDCAFILDLCTRIGAGPDDERVKGIISFLLDQQGPCGLWEYKPNPRATRWITFDILRSLASIDTNTDWISIEPRTPFQKYPKKQKRF